MHFLTGKLAKFSALSLYEQRTMLIAMAWLPLFWIGLRLMGFHRFQAWLQRAGSPGAEALSPEEITRLGALVNIAARHVPCPVTCLTRSLLLGWLLRRRGVATSLRIGVRLTHGVLDAHAWIEHAGIPVNDRKDVSEQFAPFDDGLSLEAFSSP